MEKKAFSSFERRIPLLSGKAFPNFPVVTLGKPKTVSSFLFTETHPSFLFPLQRGKCKVEKLQCVATRRWLSALLLPLLLSLLLVRKSSA